MGGYLHVQPCVYVAFMTKPELTKFAVEVLLNDSVTHFDQATLDFAASTLASSAAKTYYTQVN